MQMIFIEDIFEKILYIKNMFILPKCSNQKLFITKQYI